MSDKSDFKPLFRTSPFLDAIGEFYYKGWGADLVLGTYVPEKAANHRGIAHAGFLCTLADVALGYAAATSKEPPLNLVTMNLSLDFAGKAEVGDWLETSVELQKVGNRTAFANVYIYRGDDRIVRASSVFMKQ